MREWKLTNKATGAVISTATYNYLMEMDQLLAVREVFPFRIL